MSFQTQVNQQPSPAVEGDFASDNPRFSMDAGPGGLVTDTTLGVYVGRFAWADDSGIAHNAYPGGASPVARLGFVPREGNELALITVWLGEASLLVPPAMPITLMTTADVWARVTVANGSQGQKAFASYADGTMIPGAAGSSKTASITGDITNGSPTLGNVSAAVVPGQPVSGTGIPAGTTIITGAAAGGNATMSANATATTTALAVTQTVAVETPWYLVTAGNVGELVKLSKGG